MKCQKKMQEIYVSLCTCTFWSEKCKKSTSFYVHVHLWSICLYLLPNLVPLLMPMPRQPTTAYSSKTECTASLKPTQQLLNGKNTYENETVGCILYIQTVILTQTGHMISMN